MTQQELATHLGVNLNPVMSMFVKGIAYYELGGTGVSPCSNPKEALDFWNGYDYAKWFESFFQRHPAKAKHGV
jgi:hypothetical protein